MTRILYLDLVGGLAGDMLLAALLDLGAPIDAIRAALDRLGLHDVRLEPREVRPAGLRALALDVFVGGHLADQATVEGTPTIRTPDHDPRHPAGHGHRPWTVVRRMIEAAELPERARQIALDAFARLAAAEAAVHGVPVDSVEFHEVGADDAIADIVGVAVAVEALGIERIHVSPFPLGRGLTHGAHGPIPLPGPATLALLAGAPVVKTELIGETVTPTGAALARALATGFGPIPSMVLERVGVGAGHKTWPDRPNVVRALLGSEATPVAPLEEACVVEASLDDMNPEHLPALLERLLDAGALDAWATPAVFKKGRPGLVVGAIAPASVEPAVATAFFRHSPTLGVRSFAAARRRLERRMETVETEYGPIRVKRSPRPGAPEVLKPEHDDVARAAAAAGVPLRAVEEAALAAARLRTDEDSALGSDPTASAAE